MSGEENRVKINHHENRNLISDTYTPDTLLIRSPEIYETDNFFPILYNCNHKTFIIFQYHFNHTANELYKWLITFNAEN